MSSRVGIRIVKRPEELGRLADVGLHSHTDSNKLGVSLKVLSEVSCVLANFLTIVNVKAKLGSIDGLPVPNSESVEVSELGIPEFQEVYSKVVIDLHHSIGRVVVVNW